MPVTAAHHHTPPGHPSAGARVGEASHVRTGWWLRMVEATACCRALHTTHTIHRSAEPRHGTGRKEEGRLTTSLCVGGPVATTVRRVVGTPITSVLSVGP